MSWKLEAGSWKLEAGNNEQPARPGASPPRPAAVEDPRARAAPCVGDLAAVEADLGRRTAGERRVALPRPPQAGTGGLDQRGVETEREQSPREILRADAARPPASRARGGQM